MLAFLLDESHGLVEGDGQWVGVLRQRHILLIVQDIRTEAASTNRNVAAFELSYSARQTEELHCLLECQRVHRFIGGQLCEARFLFVVGRANLHHRSEAANLHEHWLSGCGVDADLSLAGLVLSAGVDDFFHGGLELLVELMHHLVPLRLAFGNLIEVLLHVGREVVVHDIGEVLHEEVVHDDADVGGQQLALLRAGHFLLRLRGDLLAFQCVDGERALLALLVAFVNVFALLDGGNSRCIGRRTADAQLFELVHQRSLRVADGTLAETLGSGDLFACEHVAHLHGRQQVLLLALALLVVGGLAIDFQETVELHHFSVSLEG